MIRLPLSAARKLGITAKGKRRERGTMNKNERAYSEHLEMRQHAGEVVWFMFEGIKLRLADNTTLTVDFFVMLADGTLEAHDTKGFKARPNGEPGYWCEEDFRIKIKVAAEMYPFVFKVAYRTKQGVWLSEDI